MTGVTGAPTSRAGHDAAARAPNNSPSRQNGEGARDRAPFGLRLRLAPEGWGLRKSRHVLDELGYLVGDDSAGPPCDPPERACDAAPHDALPHRPKPCRVCERASRPEVEGFRER